MKQKVENCIGKKYGKLTILKEERDDRNFIFYLCKCECGNEKKVYRSNLISGKTKSCGCDYKVSNQRFKKFNSYIIIKEKNIVIGKTTNTNKEFYIDLEDYEKIKNISWYEANTGYIMHKDKKVIQLHRFITNCPKDKVVDHINHNVKDNRKSNLRICNQKENSQNRIITKHGALNEKGITYIKDKDSIYYIVQIGGKYRGCFKDLEKAKECRDNYVFCASNSEKLNGKNYI